MRRGRARWNWSRCLRPDIGWAPSSISSIRRSGKWGIWAGLKNSGACARDRRPSPAFVLMPTGFTTPRKWRMASAGRCRCRILRIRSAIWPLCVLLFVNASHRIGALIILRPSVHFTRKCTAKRLPIPGRLWDTGRPQERRSRLPERRGPVMSKSTEAYSVWVPMTTVALFSITRNGHIRLRYCRFKWRGRRSRMLSMLNSSMPAVMPPKNGGAAKAGTGAPGMRCHSRCIGKKTIPDGNGDFSTVSRLCRSMSP